MTNTTKIVSTPYPKDMEIGIEELKVTYIQNPDTNDDSEHYQRLILSTEVACGDDMPYYINISIPNFDDGTPGHWSLDLSEDFTPILEDFQRRLESQNDETRKEQ